MKKRGGGYHGAAGGKRGPQGRPPLAAVGRGFAPASPGEAGAPCGPDGRPAENRGIAEASPSMAERLAEKQSGAISSALPCGW